VTCAFAARFNHIEILQWARANGAPWDEMTPLFAAKNRHREILEWALDNGAPGNREELMMTCMQPLNPRF
jgi:hypothetical protein